MKEQPVQETTVVEISLPADIVAAIRSRESADLPDEDRIKIPLAIGLFAERAISLAKAASLAGMTRYEFALLLKKSDIPAYEYSRQDYQEDMVFITAHRRRRFAQIRAAVLDQLRAFYDLYTRGLLDDGENAEDFAEWSGYYKLKQKRQATLEEILVANRPLC